MNKTEKQHYQNQIDILRLYSAEAAKYKSMQTYSILFAKAADTIDELMRIVDVDDQLFEDYFKKIQEE